MSVGSLGPTNPYLIARAYGSSATAGGGRVASTPVPATEPVRGVERSGAAAVVGRIGRDEPPARSATGFEALVAAVVPGGVDFSGAAPTPKADALPFYRRPGDRNEAATAWQAGRTLDVQG